MKKAETQTVLLIEPNKVARVEKMELSLEALQKAVGGTIEALYPFEEDPVGLVCNDEGKLLGLPLNRTLRGGDNNEIYDIIAGTFLIVGCNDDDFCGLTEEMVKKYYGMFFFPERFFKRDGKIESVKIMQL